MDKKISNKKFYYTDHNSSFEFKCNENNKGIRIDVFLFSQIKDKSNIKIYSRNRIKSLIENNCVSLNNEIVTNVSTKTKTNDLFKLIIPPALPAKPMPEDIPLEVLYEDKDLIVINKPAGMVVHPAFGNHSKTLVNALLYHCKGSLSGIGGISRPGIVHRLDKQTSGILVSAKNDYSHIHLADQFKNHSVTRSYFALVWGIIKQKEGTINEPIARNRISRKKMAVNPNGKSAITHWKVINYYKNFASLINCKLETGRTHQIRVHMSHLGHHLIGDPVYGSSRLKKKFLNKNNEIIFNHLYSFKRQALHAHHLSFIHPRTNKIMHFERPFPNDFDSLIKNLKLHILN